jgi:hypothetical protein
MSGVIRPDDLKRIADDVETAKAREALEKKRKVDHEREQFHDAFMSRETSPRCSSGSRGWSRVRPSGGARGHGVALPERLVHRRRPDRDGWACEALPKQPRALWHCPVLLIQPSP